MPSVERRVDFLRPAQSALTAGSTVSTFVLESSTKSLFSDLRWEFTFPFNNAFRILFTHPTRPRPPHDNVSSKIPLKSFKVKSFDADACAAVFLPPSSSSSTSHRLGKSAVEVRVKWAAQIVVEVWDGDVLVLSDLAARSYGLTEHGVIRHWKFNRNRLHLGLGEKAAPLDLTGRSFEMHATDAAWYDSYRTDPLYKHTPFLITLPKATGAKTQPLACGLYQATNGMGVWDIGGSIDYPSGGLSMCYSQDYGGLEEWVILGQGVHDVVETFSEMAGKPRLVGRDWLGYLASTMLLSDKENAQELLSQWPEDCKKHDIPCSAMHLSSGFTQDERDGNRYVFHMNTKRYPDFAGMLKVYHKAGMKVIPNVKPYILKTHPAYQHLEKNNGLFHDKLTGGPAVQNLWSSAEGVSADGSWVDLTASASREWWAGGIKGLIELGVDGIWDDNSEFFTRDDQHLFANDFDHERAVATKGQTTVGLMGRLVGNEMMNRVSHETLESCHPDRRTFVLSRSGNVAAFKYACSTWSGDNQTSWHNLRGSQHIQLNAAMSLMQSYGSDIGGFCGDAPSPELFVRWVQLGITHSRFSIHSNSSTTTGAEKLTLPWMYPQVTPIIRDCIKWRYEMLPYLYNLMWESHDRALPANAPLFYGPFANDKELYTPSILDGFDAWLGVGRILVAPALYEGMLEREVYFPKSSEADDSIYFDLHSPYDHHIAGSRAKVATPIEHLALFAREGSAIPVGKPCVTVTAKDGFANSHGDGVSIKLANEGGVVELDDWRGVLIFPESNEKVHKASWTEDDGVSAKPSRSTVTITYRGRLDRVEVSAELAHDDAAKFKPAWNETLHVVLPVGDARSVYLSGSSKSAPVTTWKGRSAWTIKCSGRAQ